MDREITAREFLVNTFNTDFLTSEELETIIKAMELYAKGRVREFAEEHGIHLCEQEKD